ncbi:MAG: hypothetical protein IJD16_02000 [Desulfovibrio sp.]|nr:hypothetical protein [Desulfovibrio sp.]
MMKRIFLVKAMAVLLLCANTVWGASFLVFKDAPLLTEPNSSARILAQADTGWLLRASPVDGVPGWYAVSEFQTASGTGFAYAHRMWPVRDGYAYIAEHALMPVPDQGEAVFPAEDAYTPPADSEGLVPCGPGNSRLPLGGNSLQKAVRFDFGLVFMQGDAHGTASGRPLSFSVLSINKDRVNPWKYAVDAEIRFDEQTVRMDGTFTLKKAADFIQQGQGMKLAGSNQKCNSRLHGTPNGFVSVDVELRERGGVARMQGILTAYFLYETNPHTRALQVTLNDIPEQQENPHYRNLFFSGTWQETPNMAGMPRGGGANPLQNFPDIDGKLLQKVDFEDSQGDRAVILTHSGVYPASAASGEVSEGTYNADLYAYGFSDIFSDKPQRNWMMRDHVRQCVASVTAEFAEVSPVITDLDRDGNAEVWIIYYIGCRGDVSPEGMKIHLFDGIRRFSMTGETLVRTPDGEMGGSYRMDPAFDKWPAVFREFAVELWANNRIR